MLRSSNTKLFLCQPTSLQPSFSAKRAGFSSHQYYRPSSEGDFLDLKCNSTTITSFCDSYLPFISMALVLENADSAQPKTFRFLHGLDNRYSGTTRAFVLRSYHRARKTRTTTQKCIKCTHFRKSTLEVTGCPDSNTAACSCDRGFSKSIPSLIIPNVGRYDPFDTMPRSLTSQEHFLLDFCESSILCSVH